MAETEARSKAVALQAAAEKARQDEVAQRELAEQRRLEADQAREAMQLNLSDVYTAHGVTSSERNESAQAALWFANAARLARKDPDRELATNLAYASAIAWLLIQISGLALPASDDIEGLVRLWQRVFAARPAAAAETRRACDWLRQQPLAA